MRCEARKGPAPLAGGKTVSSSIRLVPFWILAFLLPLHSPALAAAGDEPAERRPASLSRSGLVPLGAVAVRSMPPVNVAALLEEDEANRGRAIPYRVGYPFATDLSPGVSGTWGRSTRRHRSGA